MLVPFLWCGSYRPFYLSNHLAEERELLPCLNYDVAVSVVSPMGWSVICIIVDIYWLCGIF